MQATAESLRLKIDFAQATDPGRDPNKQVNEDSCGYAETKFGHLCVLCDGMGGHYGGKEASRTAITTIFEVIEKTPPEVLPVAALKAAIEEAARRVYTLGGPPDNKTRPGSTVVAMLLHDKGVDVAHVGDSRAYVIRSNQIYPLTRDHSMVQGMIDAGMLTEEQAIGHPDANKITRALGMKPEVDVEVRPEPMELFPGDVLLQSSDGLTDLALGADILGATRQALASGPVQHACNMLVQMANDRGGHDNITVQMVRVTDVGARVKTTIPQAPARPVAQAVAAGPVSAGQPRAPWAGSSETVQMTSPDGQRAQAHPPMGPPVAAARAPQAPFNVSPTIQSGPASGAMHAGLPPRVDPVRAASDGAGFQRVMDPVASPYPPPAPTVHDGREGPQSLTPAWNSGMYTGPTPPHVAQGPQALAPYRLDQSPQALPLPPSSQRPYGHGQMVPPAGGGAPPMMPMTPMPPAATFPEGPRPRGGIVFVIIGASAVIAVLIVVILWAVLAR